MLLQIDDYVASIRRIKNAGVADNTIFIFTSDNGGEMFMPAHGFKVHGGEHTLLVWRDL